MRSISNVSTIHIPLHSLPNFFIVLLLGVMQSSMQVSFTVSPFPEVGIHKRKKKVRSCFLSLFLGQNLVFFPFFLVMILFSFFLPFLVRIVFSFFFSWSSSCFLSCFLGQDRVFFLVFLNLTFFLVEIN